MSDLLTDALAHVFGAEGGYVDHPADRGGRTAYGIAERKHPALWVNGPPTLSAARAFYTALWNQCGADRIGAIDGRIAIAHFDAAVNHGPARAAILLQRALGGGIAQDGVLGPATLAQLDHVVTYARRGRSLLADLLFERLRFFRRICLNDRTQLAFILGWLGRCIDLHDSL